MTNVDIEDVLSSIKRLVTEERRGPVHRIKLRPSDAAKPPVSEAAREAPTRLLLTPSLRVSGDAPPPERAAAGAAGVDDIEFRRTPVRDLRANPNATLHGAAAAVQGEAEQPEEAASAETVPETVDPLVLSGAIAAEPEPDVAAEPEEELEPEATAAAPEPAADTEAAAPPEPGPEPQTAEPGVGTERLVQSAKVAQLRARGQTLQSKIAALEAAIAQTPGRWEPDGSGMDDHDAAPIKTIPWTDHVPEAAEPPEPETAEPEWEDAELDDELTVAAEPEMQVEEPPEAALDDTPDDDAPDDDIPEDAQDDDSPEDDTADFLDEESLRRLVAEIVREELQGPLGERITRNVRKLVRAEIQRALAAHGLG
ncbi:MAG: hypothetical protein KDK24_17310 [Pseudooceanicola sp.]|nr:hypothetical protein [Pseudooceanicola sp.]